MGPDLSLVVITFNNGRELPRTLHSLAPPYQRGIARENYEVIVVDNGSRAPTQAAAFADLSLNLRLLRCPAPTSSPVAAINQGLAAARGRHWAVMIDGARLASPGLLALALEALQLSPRAVVGSRGRYLGPGRQSITMRFGYNQRTEDNLLARCGWERDGYRLFAHSVFDESSGLTWFDGDVTESNALFMARELWRELGGYDGRFQLPGGGLVNLDLWKRACEAPGSLPILLLGEATFHQFHGGVATNSPDQTRGWLQHCADYARIRGQPYEPPCIPLRYWGTFRHRPARVELVGGWRSLGPRRIRALARQHWRRLSGKA